MSISPANIVEIENAVVQKLNHPLLQSKDVSIEVIRFDKIHPVISGNKFFKLKYSLQQVIDQRKKGILTFGGAWSNHLVATAAACAQLGLRSIGIIRGERPANVSQSILDLEKFGMKLIFISREEYRRKENEVIQSYFQDYILVPEGGAHEAGVIGASEMVQSIPQHPYELITCAIGTGTMISGILRNTTIPVMGFSSLKLPDTIHNSITENIEQYTSNHNYSIEYNYHFGGFGKITESLISFMNDLYLQTGLPTDIVYTGKMLYGLFDMINNDRFAAGTRILAIHSGGLQGNRSVKNGALRF